VRRFPRDAVLRAVKRMDFSSLREVDAGHYIVSEEKMTYDIQDTFDAPVNASIMREGRVAMRAGVPILEQRSDNFIESGTPIIPASMAGRRVRVTITFLPDEKN
jgi:hypothetical protein